ncbi:hypothetical protein J4212_07375 [Candidatus Woesearchaeota archaeon]|nr:hypothetical protein [Candidatus Woesearchaeota archaeon]
MIQELERLAEKVAREIEETGAVEIQGRRYNPYPSIKNGKGGKYDGFCHLGTGKLLLLARDLPVELRALAFHVLGESAMEDINHVIALTTTANSEKIVVDVTLRQYFPEANLVCNLEQYPIKNRSRYRDFTQNILVGVK